MSKVSIIIAAFNMEKYLADTLDSAVSQTLKDIEIILVDDCSTDNTLKIAQQYAALDDRIKIVHHEVNKSAMQVRKTGVDAATGDYIMFLDGDDMLTPNACEDAYKAITKEKVDMLQFDTNVFFDDPKKATKEEEEGIRTYLKSVPYKLISISPYGLLDSKKVKSHVNFTVWNKIYSAALLKKANQCIPDAYANMAEDVFFSCFVQYYARSYACIFKRLYNYRFGAGISTSSAKPTERQLAAIAKNAYLFHYLKNWFREQGAEKACAPTLQRVHEQLFTQILYTYFHRLEKEQKNDFINQVKQYCDPEDVILALSTYMEDKHVTANQLATEIANLDLFKAEKKEVKTIGTFYFRMYNGGVENVLSSLTDIWTKNGYQVILFTDAKPNKDDFYINPNVKRIILPAMTDSDYETREKRVYEFRRAMLENNVDLMVYHAWVNPYIVLDEMIVKSCGASLIVHSHSMFCADLNSADAFYAHYFSSINQLCEPADLIVTLSDVDTVWWNALGLKAAKTINPIQLSLDTKTVPLDGKTILFVGRLSWEKNVMDVLKVMQKVHKEVPDAKLIVLGKGDDKAYVNSLFEYIEKNKMKDYVDMAGFDSNILPYYQKSDILLSTSKYEGFGLALIESKICGMPMVCYDLPNLDIVRNSRGMCIVEQNDVTAAANAIIKLLTDDNYKKQMGAEARKSAEDLLSLDLAKHWDKLFAMALEQKTESADTELLPPLETALRLAIKQYTEGIAKRSSTSGINTADVEAYIKQNREMATIIKGLQHSESYRVGLALTYLPRKIKSLLKRKK